MGHRARELVSIDAIPSPQPAALWLKDYLRGWANQIAARYGHPVYLVGSALTEEHPRDVDVVCILPDDEFFARFGCDWTATNLLGSIGGVDVEHGSRWYAEVAKLSRYATKVHGNGRTNIDFKVQSTSWQLAREAGKRMLRIDTVALEEEL